MPNIEIHGFGSMQVTPFEVQQSTEEYHRSAGVVYRLWECLQKLFDDTAFKDDVVVSLVEDSTHSLKGRRCPFLRVVSTPQDYLPDVIKRLKTLGMDLEVLLLAEFHESKK